MSPLDKECDHLGCQSQCVFVQFRRDVNADIVKAKASINSISTDVVRLMENKAASEYFGFDYTTACSEAFLALRAAVEALSKATK